MSGHLLTAYCECVDCWQRQLTCLSTDCVGGVSSLYLLSAVRTAYYCTFDRLAVLSYSWRFLYLYWIREIRSVSSD